MSKQQVNIHISCEFKTDLMHKQFFTPIKHLTTSKYMSNIKMFFAWKNLFAK